MSVVTRVERPLLHELKPQTAELKAKTVEDKPKPLPILEATILRITCQHPYLK